MFELLGMREKWSTPLHPKSDSMVGRYVNVVEEHLRKFLSTHQRDLDESLPIFRLAVFGGGRSERKAVH
jgi:hypothetical protein